MLGFDKPETSAFDVWLCRALHDLYRSAANERVPDEMLDLLREPQTRN